MYSQDQLSSLKSKAVGRGDRGDRGGGDGGSNSARSRRGDSERERDRVPPMSGSSVPPSGSEGSGGGRRSRREPSLSSRSGRDRGRERERSREAPSGFPSARSDDGKSGGNDDEIARLRSDYEFKIAMMEKQLKEASSVTRDRESDQVKLLQNQISKMEQNSMQIQGEYDRLQADFDRLAADFERNSKVILFFNGS